MLHRPGRTPDAVELTIDEWMAVLKLAKSWSLNGMEQLAVQKAESHACNMEPIEKIVFAKRLGVAKWLKEGYLSIGNRKETINKDEKAKLDLPTYVGLLELRDKSWEWAINTYGGNCYHYRGNFDFEAAILDIFGEEVKGS
jgi:hypothetical protein